MSDYLVYTTTELASNSQDNQLEEFLSNFECQINLDIQNFVRNKAIDFEKRGIAVTHLVFLGHTNDFVGFFTLAIKILEVNVQSMSKSLAKRLARFGEIEEDNTIKIPAILIAQFGKNLSADIEKPISGVELMELALAYVTKAQSIVGGRFVYLECEDNENLLSFYEAHDFTVFNAREANNSDEIAGTRRLIQLARYMH